MLGIACSFSLFAQVDVVSGSSSSECYVEQSSNVTYTFDLGIAGIDANSVTFVTTASGISFSNPVNGNTAGTQAVDFNGTFVQGTVHSFMFDISALNNVGVVNITATVNGTDNSSDTYNFPLSFVSANPVTSVVCNSHVNVTLDTNCEWVIHPDQILEGSNYSCWDLYTVDVQDANGNSLGNTVNYNQVGQTLNVQVTGPNNNICWGLITVDDKFAPVFYCQDAVTSCVDDVTPGASLSSQIYVNNAHAYAISGTAILSGLTTVSGLVNSTITADGVLVSLDITHPDLTELAVTLTSPSGTAASFTTFTGQTFTDFTGENPNGNWIVTIADSSTAVPDLTEGTLNGVSFMFNQINGVIPFPVPAGVTVSPLGNNTYTASIGLDACSPTTIQYNDSVQDPGCSSPYAEIITRTWTGVDESGNTSGCIQTIYIYRTGLQDIIWPSHYDDADLPSLDCAQYGDVVPDPSVTGSPYGYLCSNIEFLDHEDQIFEHCERSYKIHRKWKAVDWCSGGDMEYVQVILVKNDHDPVISCPSAQVISTHPYSCNAQYNVVAPSISFTCSTIYSWDVSYSATETGTYTTIGISGNQNSGFVISDLPIGRTWIKYSVIDDCLNSSECITYIDVMDQIDPYPVCDEHTVVSIQGFSNSFAEAITFDDGSTDNCGVSHFEVRKVVDVCSGNTAFGPSVMFCCDEVNTTVQVELRVWDTSNNSSTCLVEVTVQDLLPPYFTSCPADMTMNCGSMDYTNHAITGMPVAIDNCSTLPLEEPQYNVNLNSCGEGTVTKTWEVFDLQGFKDVCVQTIYIVNNDPFELNDIIWPEDYDVSNCNVDGLDPEDLPAENDRPDVSNSDECDMVSSTHIDQTFPFGNNGIKILRKWSVIDWCRYDQSTGAGYWEYEQIIKCTDATGSVLAIEGMIRDEYNARINNVTVTLDNTNDGFPKTVVNDPLTSSYFFSNLVNNETYTISADKSDDPMNGVTTLDLALIQRHLLGSQLHDSPYKIIASDIDGNDKVSALDLIHLRKLIIGVYLDFPNNQKDWRFTMADAVIPDPTDPFPFTEIISIVGINQPHYQEDFIGIKIGDVSGDANPINLNTTSENRNDQEMDFEVLETEENNLKHYAFYSSNTDLKGFQLGLDVNASEVMEVFSSLADLDESNYAIHDDHIAISWNHSSASERSIDQPLFTVVVKKDASIELSDLVRAEAFDSNFEANDISITSRSIESLEMELHQNVPNPFSKSTTIRYTLQESNQIKMTVYDTNGKVVISSFANGKKGINEIQISAEDLPSGLLYYQLETEHGSITKKMIVVN